MNHTILISYTVHEYNNYPPCSFSYDNKTNSNTNHIFTPQCPRELLPTGPTPEVVE